MDKTVYISYSHHAKDIDKYIKAIELGLTEAGIDYSIDFKNLLYRDNIKEYEEEIGKGFRCIAIITPEYLESPHCMYELAQIFENENVRERMFPLVDTGKYTRDTSGLSLLKEFWDTERNKTYEKAVSPSPFTAGELKTTDDIYHKLDSIWDYLRYTNSENIDELTQNKAEKLVSAIKKSFENEDTQKILEKSNLKTEGLSNIDRDVPFQQNVNQNGPNPITIGIANAPITINTYRN